MDAHEKLEALKDDIRKTEGMAVSFSGGVDSTFLLKVAFDVLGDQAIAVTARSPAFPERELREADAFAATLGVRHIVFDSEELKSREYADNPADRCYYCKRKLLEGVRRIAKENGIRFISDGSNQDDLGDFRPGMKAAEELHVASPLKAAGLRKDDIRLLSKEMGLPTWNKPSFACFASRIPYGQKITREKLAMVDKAERFLLGLGFRQVRVRHHGDLARIEVEPEARGRFFAENLAEQVCGELKRIGFTYVTLDLEGYRTGSMNEALRAPEEKK